jgi:hypothetical protein
VAVDPGRSNKTGLLEKEQVMMPNSMFSRIVFSLTIALTVAGAADAQARPYRGGIPWSFILCKFSDSPAPPNDVNYYRNMTIVPGTKGLDDYVKAISYGKADMSGSVLHGWYTEAHTLAYEQAQDRGQRVRDCLDAAKTSPTDPYIPPSGQRVYVFTSPLVDLAGWENTQAIGGDQTGLPEIAHEFGHGVGLNHSWSNDVTWKDASWAGGGEYDNRWDLMSAGNVYVDPTGAFTGGPPDLDAHHLDEMGWLPKSRILTLGVDGILSRTVTLAALTHPEASGYLLARIPFDASDRFHYYTVEYRTPDGWDSGIPANIVMINEVQDKGQGYYQTTLLRELGSFAGTGNGPPLQSINANGVTITVQGTSGDQATIKISTQFALLCAQGYVWREASAIDRVCVPPATRTQAAADNAAANSRHLPNSTTCVQGYVWREAYPGDVVCVTPATRAQARTDNANAYNHVNESLVTYGPNTCQNGYVWRDGDDSDYVCVSNEVRAQARADNAAAGSRHVPNSDICVQGYVWREAWPGDHVCVTPATRSQAQSDNGQATQRLWKLFAALPSAPPVNAANPSSGFVSTAVAAEALPEPTSPAPMSEDVVRVRLAKLGYTEVRKLVRIGDYWEATVIKNGAPRVIRFHALTGAMQLENPMPRPLPK